MNALIAIAFKSVLVAGLTLLVLRLVRDRSAAERSWVAHVGLVALLVLPFAPIAVPQLTVESAIVGAAPKQDSPVTTTTTTTTAAPAVLASPIETAPAAVQPQAAAIESGWTAVDFASFLYWIPAALLLGITLLALGRLIALRARADVLVDAHWLSALARAQKRMGFKHGTALLTSNDLPSPISWGLMRPVILLNPRAVDAAGEAEAIIAHELAHVARLDWAKLLLARVATAFFWFNPLVWMLAREAHQLREEAADDSVLAADIEDTEYAQLLVGVARHECSGLLIGAHGVAPSKSSLARRVARVLDSRSPRGPVAKSFAAGVFVGALAIATPLAALTLVPTGTKSDAALAEGESFPAGGVPLPTTIQKSVDQAVGTAVSSAVSAVQPIWSDEQRRDLENEAARSDGHYYARSPNGATIETHNGQTVLRSPDGATITIYPANRRGLQKVVMRSANGAVQTFADARNVPGLGGLVQTKHKDKRDSAIEEAITMKAVGVTPAWVAEMRAAAPHLGDLDNEDLIELRAVGVTPHFVQDLASAGFRNVSKDELVEARALGVSSSYIRSIRAAGFRGSLEDYGEMRAVGITPHDISVALRGAGGSVSADEIIELKTEGPPEPPEPPEHDDDDD